MYPNDDNYQYVYCSRKMFYSKSKNVVNYIKRIVNTKKKTLWVDIQGSGDSHAYFFKKHFGSIPNKIYYTLNSLQLMSKGLKKDCSLSISDYHLFSGFTKSDFSGKYNLKNYCDFVEGLCRSPTQSIIDIEGEQTPIYSKKKDTIKPFFNKKISKQPYYNMQMKSLPKIYIQNASLEISKVSNLKKYDTITGKRIMPFFTKNNEGFDINYKIDLLNAKKLFNNKKKIN